MLNAQLSGTPIGSILLSVAGILALFAALTTIRSSIKILREYERAVVFTLGRYQGTKGPGLVLLIPFIQEMVRVDLRIQVIEIPSQDVISRDNVSMKVDAVLYFNVVNPEHAIIQVQHYLPATNMLAQTTLRAVLGQHELDEMLSERKKLNSDVQSILDSQTETWGIKVSDGNRRRAEFDRRLPDADRYPQAVHGDHAARRQARRAAGGAGAAAQWPCRRARRLSSFRSSAAAAGSLV